MRLFYLDSARAVLMLLGVVLHVSSVYSVGSNWWVVSADASLIYNYLNSAIHTFRMPAFFLISGFFSAMVISKKGHREFIRSRFARLIVPVSVCAWLINYPQSVFLNRYGNRSVYFFTDTGWVYHLWFLNYLFIYVILLYGSKLWLLKTPVRLRLPSLLYDNLANLMASALVAMFGIHLLASFCQLRYHEYFGRLEIYGLSLYGLMFLIGVGTYYNKKLLSTVVDSSALGLIPCGILLTLEMLYFHTMNSKLGTALVMATSIVLGIWMSAIVLALFKRYLNFSNKYMSFISGASYSIYLLHHPLVLLFGAVFNRLYWNIHLEALISIVAIFAITSLIHGYLISKYRILSFLLNGK